jgi:DNA-binding transcriptional LysR family regulator
MVDIAEKTAFRIKQMEGGHFGSISISALTTSSSALSKCLAVFSKKWPNIMTDITFTSGRSQVIAMNEQKYDFQFAGRKWCRRVTARLYSVAHRSSLRGVSAEHPLAGKPLDFTKLRGERFIGVSETDGPTLYNQIMKVCAAREFVPNVVCQYDRAEAVLLSVGAGVGISIIPEALSRVFYSENISFTRIPEADAIRTYVVAWHKNMTNPSAKLFLDVVREMYDKQ